MAPRNTAGGAGEGGDETRIPRTISIPAYQDRWLTELLGEKGNLSAFTQALYELARTGEIDTRKLLARQKDKTTVQRAVAYLKAKEAAMLFEEDVHEAVKRWAQGRRGVRVVRGRIHNGEGMPFVADFSVEREGGEVIVSVECKSSPRSDRLQLALAEAMIGQQKTGKPVLTVVPYLVEDSADVLDQFKALGYALAELRALPDQLTKVVKV